MFIYGIPNHAFDTAKSTDNLIWQMNPRYTEFTSLDKTKLTLDQSILMINNPSKALSLSFWGGEACAITESTTDTIIEMAIYNPTTVRQNSRQLKTVTEAAIRLEKQLDPKLIPIAINHLVKLIIDNCTGTIGSQLFDYYPNPVVVPVIKFDPKLPSIMSGINIPEDFALDSWFPT
jgi:phenylalanyl-tRNA synthetase beta chain